MKIKPEHFEALKTAINDTLAKNPDVIRDYETGNFPRADKVKDLQKRFCFDLANASTVNGKRFCEYCCHELYSYVHDEHIYTALKAICPAVTRRY